MLHWKESLMETVKKTEDVCEKAEPQTWQNATKSRAEHLAWCKQRALEYLPGDPQQAFASMASDMRKHDETRNHAGLEMGMMLMMTGNLGDMRKFIEGFN